MQNYTPADLAVLGIELAPAMWFGLFGKQAVAMAERWPFALRVCLPAMSVVPYVFIATQHNVFSWAWFALYLCLPLAVAGLLVAASSSDPEQTGAWEDALVLLVLGLAVDLRWLERAWPPGLAGMGKLLLVDIGLYGFAVIRKLKDTGFDFHFRWSDWKTGLRELTFFAPIVIGLGIALGFLHPHGNVPMISMVLRWALTWIYIFVFVAVPEELFFRAWVQNLLERRFVRWLEPTLARRWALVIASILFGLSHFNKRSTHFNWRYVILASIAGIFYGRAWRENRRVPASTITHASVDAIWSFWF